MTVAKSKDRPRRLVLVDEEEGAGELDALLAVVRRHLYLPDPTSFYVTVASIIANKIGQQVWMMLVGPASCGGTETINTIKRVQGVRFVERFTEGGLLSGVSLKDMEKGASGGLLLEMKKEGDGSTIVIKDFTGILTGMGKDEQGKVLGALRDVYDGGFGRQVGTGGSKYVGWEGRVGLLSKCTLEIDNHAREMAVMGDRFLYYRYPLNLDYDRAATTALENTSTTWRQDIALAVGMVVADVIEKYEILSEREKDPRVKTDDISRLVAMASVVAQARTGVQRNWKYKNEIDNVGEAEGTQRIALGLKSLWISLTLMGIGKWAVWKAVREVAASTVPGTRGYVLRVMLEKWKREKEVSGDGNIAITVGDVVEALTIPGKPVVLKEKQIRFGLEELTVLGLVIHKPGALSPGKDGDGGVGGRPRDVYVPSDWLKDKWMKGWGGR